MIDIPVDATPFGTLRDGYDPLGGNDPIGATLRWSHAGGEAAMEIDPPVRLALGPAVEVAIQPRCQVRRRASATPVRLVAEGAAEPPDWQARCAAEGCHELTLPGSRLAVLEPGVALVEPARAWVLRAPIAIDQAARVGVVGGGTDVTLDWLSQLDIAAEAVDDAALVGGNLGRFTTLVVGVFGFGQRPALRAARERLLAWAAAGGGLVTLYHRPGDGWQEGRAPPLPITIGQPSLRWRVTDPAAPVTMLLPEHVLLQWPNVIGPDDWQGWVRERGLYFASAWDPAYVPLLEMADAGEAPLHGALLAAPFGRGRHVHVALALHHQFSALVPGAFRLMANLVSRVDGGDHG